MLLYTYTLLKYMSCYIDMQSCKHGVCVSFQGCIDHDAAVTWIFSSVQKRRKLLSSSDCLVATICYVIAQKLAVCRCAHPCDSTHICTLNVLIIAVKLSVT